MRYAVFFRLAGVVIPALCGLSGCARISVAPTCPEELEVGGSGAVRANQRNPGAIATYRWEVVPSSVGRIVAPDQADSTFEALAGGTATIRLTAADGLFQVIGQCQTTVTSVSTLAVILDVTPAAPVVGETVVLSCASVGATPAPVRTFEQVGGPPVTLSSAVQGTASFVATEAGDLTFRCVGRSGDGVLSATAELSVTITGDGGRGGRRGTPDSP